MTTDARACPRLAPARRRRDRNRARALYADVLGLAILAETAAGMLLGSGAPPRALLVLVVAEPGAERVPLARALVVAQGGSRVLLGTSGCDTTYRRALAHGLAPVREPSKRPDGARACVVRDPWANTLWFVQPARVR